MLTIFIRILLIYLLLILTMRFMGKRQIGQLQLSELVTTILLSELAVQPITDENIPLSFAVVPIATLISLEIIISFAVTKLPFLKPIFDGKPSILINRGEINFSEIARVRISMEELLSQLRIAGTPDISEVYYAILEQNGQLSVIPRRNDSPPTGREIGKKVKEVGIPHALIVDSEISEFDLNLIGKDKAWLAKKLKKRGVTAKDVFLFTIDDDGKENLIIKPCAHS